MDKTETKEMFKSQQKVSFISLVTELPNFIALGVLAILSGSMLLFLDALESLGNVTQSTMSVLLSKKLQGSDSFKYDYGMGKIEAFGGLASAILMLIGLAAMFTTSIYALLNPKAPAQTLIFAIVLKVINVLIDAYLLYTQMKTVKKSDSSLIQSNILSFRKVLIFDSVTLLTVTSLFLLRGFPYASYIDPIMCIACCVYITVLNVKLIRESSADLLDKTLDEATQMKILKCVSKIWDGIEGFNGIRTRRSGHIIYIDLMAAYGDDKSYADIYGTYKVFDAAVKEIIPDSVTAIVIGDAQ